MAEPDRPPGHRSLFNFGGVALAGSVWVLGDVGVYTMMKWDEWMGRGAEASH